MKIKTSRGDIFTIGEETRTVKMTKQYKVIWPRTAERDLESILDYIAKDSPINAKKVFIKLRVVRKKADCRLFDSKQDPSSKNQYH